MTSRTKTAIARWGRRILLFGGMGLIVGMGYLLINSSLVVSETMTARGESAARVYAMQLYLSSLKDAERGQRGFIITGNRNYLGPYTLGVSSSLELYRHIYALSERDDPERRKLLVMIGGKMDAKFAEMNQTIRMIEDGHSDAAQAIVNTHVGQGEMEEIIAIMNRIINIERASFDLDLIRYQVATRHSVVGNSIAVFVSTILMFFALAQIEYRRRVLNQVLAAKAEIAQQELRLRQITLNELRDETGAMTKLQAIADQMAITKERL